MGGGRCWGNWGNGENLFSGARHRVVIGRGLVSKNKCCRDMSHEMIPWRFYGNSCVDVDEQGSTKAPKSVQRCDDDMTY